MATAEENETVDAMIVETYSSLNVRSPSTPVTIQSSCDKIPSSHTSTQPTTQTSNTPKSSCPKNFGGLQMANALGLFLSTDGKEKSVVEKIHIPAENYSSPNTSKQMNSILDERLNKKKKKNLLTKISKILPPSVPSPSPPQTLKESIKEISQKPNSPTILVWDENQFIIQTEGSTEDLIFIMQTQPPVKRAELQLLDNSISFTGEDFVLQHQNEEEKMILGLRINYSRNELLITSNGTYRGNISDIRELHNAITNETIENPSSQDLVSFLNNCKIDQIHPEENESEFDDEESAAPSDDKKGASELDDDEESATPSDDKKGSTQKRKKKRPKNSSKEPKKGIPKPRKASQLEIDGLHNLEKRILIQQNTLPKPEIKNLRLNVLQHDETIRSTSRANVDTLLNQLNSGLWEHTVNYFIVIQIEGSEMYLVLDGNHRLIAFREFNASAEKSRQIVSVKCKIYKNLDFDQILLLTSSTHNQYPRLNLTVLQLTSLTLKTIRRHSLAIPTSIKSEEAFTKTMKAYFKENYPSVVTQLVRLPADAVAQILEIQCNDIPIAQMELTITFWKTFLSAFKKNDAESLKVLSTLGDNSKEKVEKMLKNVEQNILSLMSDKCAHSYADETSLIKFLVGEREISRKSFLENLRAVGFFRNRKRRSTSDNYLADLKVKLDKHFAKNRIHKNAVYQASIDDNILLEQNVIIVQNATQTFLNQLKEYYYICTFILLSNYGEAAVSFPEAITTADFDEEASLDSKSTEYVRAAVVDVLVDEEVEIDLVSDELPVPTIRATIYLPDIPPDTNPTRHLTAVAKEKSLCLAKTMCVNKLYNLCKLSTTFDNVLIANTSVKITEQLLKDLSFFKKITVTGGNELNDLVTQCYPEKEGEDTQVNENNLPNEST